MPKAICYLFAIKKEKIEFRNLLKSSCLQAIEALSLFLRLGCVDGHKSTPKCKEGNLLVQEGKKKLITIFGAFKWLFYA